MSLPTSAYAALADDSYKNRVADPDKQHTIDGRTYKVLATASHWTGYQGTIYQDVDTSEIIVAHRGSEREQLLQDWALTNGGMVLNRVNPQLGPAAALTERALQIAREQERDYGLSIRVSTTGHSLGGTIGQVIAHRYGLSGETFNAYGAVSLNLEVPEGGRQVINHVRATDIVSAASRHFGEVRAYALRQDVQDLLADGQDPRTQGIGGFVSDIRRVGFDPHDIQQFYRHTPAAGAPLVSAGNARRHDANRAMFDVFRHDIYQTRALLSNGADVSNTLLDAYRTAGVSLASGVVRGDHGLLPQELDAGVPDVFRREAVNRLQQAREIREDVQHHTGRVIDAVREGGRRAVEAGMDQGRHLVDGARQQGERWIDGIRDGVRDGGERLQALARQGVLPPTPVTAAALLAVHAAARQADPQPPPDHPLYRQAYDGLRQLDPQKIGLHSEQDYRNAAGALAAGAHTGGLQRIDHVLANRDGSGLFAVQGSLHDPAHHRIHVDTAKAALQPLAQSLQQWQQESRRQAEPDLVLPQPQAARGMTY